jgi:hypothetical protein
VDHRDARGEPAEERRLLQRGVAAADDRDVLVAEEEAVAGGAPGHAVAGQPLLAGHVELPVGRTCGEDDGARPVADLADADLLDLAGELEVGGVVGDELGSEVLRLLA